jgi:Serine carboxypeptidase
VGGYVVEHPKLTFASVRNAGHMVPYTQPERAYFMFSRWVSSNRRGYIDPAWLHPKNVRDPQLNASA